MPDDAAGSGAGEGTVSTPERLLQATAALIVESGWGDVSTRQVAEQAGVPPGLVHYHFESVEQLKRRAVLGALQGEIDRVVGPMQDLSPRQIVVAASDMLDTVGAGDPLSILVLEALPAAARDAELERELAGMLTWFRDLLAERIRACHPAPQAPPELLAELFAALFDGLGMHRIALPDLDVHAHFAPLLELLGPELDAPTTDGADEEAAR